MLTYLDGFIEGYTDACRHLSLTDLYREQDRLIRVAERLRTLPHPPYAMVHMLERKMEALEILMDRKYLEKSKLTKPDVLPMIQ